MTRTELDKYITDYYGGSAEYLWASAPSFAVYRHCENNKWFAVIMDIPKSKLGLDSGDTVSVVNLKCDPMLIGTLVMEDGIHRGYHMNKNYWITLRLDGSVDTDKIKLLLDMSFELTI